MVAVRAWIFAALAALLVLMPSGGGVHSQHYCRMLGRVVASCCCGDAAAPPSSQPEIRQSDCCQRISSPAPSALATDKALRFSPAPSALLAVVAVPVIAPSTANQGPCRESTQAPPAIGPPLFVKHCALLS